MPRSQTRQWRLPCDTFELPPDSRTTHKYDCSRSAKMASASHVLPRQKAGKMLSIMSAETEAFKTTNDRSQAHVGAHDCPLRVIDVGMWVQRTPTVNALIATKLLDDDLELTEAGWAVLGKSLMKMPSGRPWSSRARFVLRIDSGRLRKSSPSIARTSKAQS